MSEKPDAEDKSQPITKPPIPDAPNDGFPAEKDVSIPPPGSDVRSGKHKEDDA